MSRIFEGDALMDTTEKIAVCSRSFSRNPTLRAELLSRYPQVTFNDSGKQLEGDELVDFLKGHSKAITALEKINESILSRLPELRVIGKYGVGLDMIDLRAMERYGVRLGWRPGVNKRSAAELTLAFILMMLRGIPKASAEVRSGIWHQYTGSLLTGRTVGIIGCGNIGKDLVKLLEPFQCQILIHDIALDCDFNSKYNIQPWPIEDLLKHSDIVTLHLPLNTSTHNIISADRLALMKPSAILINAARGGLVDEGALKLVLSANKIAGAAFDVFHEEPPSDHALIASPNFLATPHIGGSSKEAILAMGRAAIEGLDNNHNATNFIDS
jgi:D-3-phosphoglycerate dehydrogenase